MFATWIGATATQNDTSWYMWDHPSWYWGMGIHWFFWIALVVLLFAAGFSLIRSSTRPEDATKRSAIAILEDRYARGEIDRGEYLERKRDLT